MEEFLVSPSWEPEITFEGVGSQRGAEGKGLTHLRDVMWVVCNTGEGTSLAGRRGSGEGREEDSGEKKEFWWAQPCGIHNLVM